MCLSKCLFHCSWFLKGSDSEVTSTDIEQLTASQFGKKIECQQGQLQTGSVSESTTMPVSNFCKLFPSSWIKWSENLELLKMDDCGSLEVIFDLDKLCIEEGQAILPRLKEVDLRNLTKLTHIWKNGLHGMQGFQSLTSLVIVKCSSIRNLLSPSIAKLFMELQHLAVIDCQMIEEIVAEGPEEESGATDTILFPKLVDLRLDSLPNLVSFFCSGVCAFHLPFLAFLRLDNCPNMKRTFPSLRQLKKINVAQHSTVKDVKSDTPVTHYLFDEEVKLSSIKALMVYDMNNLTDIWYGQLEAESFYDLIVIDVHRCPNIVHVIPSSLLNRLQNLEKLEVSFCYSLQGVIQLEEPNVEVSDDSLRKLTSMIVKNCGKLLNVIPFKLLERFQHLEKVTVMECALLVEVFESKGVSVEDRHATTSYQLEELTLESLPQLMHIWRNPKRVLSFEKLRCVEVNDCSNLRNLFSASMAQSLVQLQALKIRNCVTMREIIVVDEEEEVVAGANKKIVFHCLYSLELKNLPDLATFCKELYALEWPLLGIVNIHDCPKLKTIKKVTVKDCASLVDVFESKEVSVEDRHATTFYQLEELTLESLPQLMHIGRNPKKVLNFPKLRCVEVNDCSNLRHLFSASMAQSLVQLQALKIHDCVMMEEIFIVEEKYEVVAGIMFPCLYSLELINLPNLTSFCKQFYALEWPSLGIVNIHKCPKMKTFSIGFLSAPKLEEAFIDTGERHFLADQNYQQVYFTKEVTLSRNEELLLGGVDNTEIWLGQRQPAFVSKLRVMKLQDCNNLLNVVPSDFLQKSHYLEQLQVWFCRSVEVVFDLQGLNVRGQNAVVLPQLRELQLWQLPKLAHIWTNGAPGIQSFQNLSRLHVFMCNRLRNLSSVSMAKILVNLRILQVEYCEMIEEVVVKEEDDEGVEEKEKAIGLTILFPQLSDLILLALPNLVRFGPQTCTFTWPSLKSLSVKFCPKIETLAPVSLYAQKHNVKFNESHQEVGFQHWEKFEIWGTVNSEVGLGQIPDGFLCKIKIMDVRQCDNLLNVVPFYITERLRNLKILYVEKCASLVEVFETEGVNEEEGHTTAFSLLETIILISLPKLLHVWKNPKVALGFQNLRWLEVKDCGNLVHLILPSMAGNLVQLQTLKVVNCMMIEEIVAREEEETEEAKMSRIVLPQLHSLELKCLSNLKSFCGGIHAYELPLLACVNIDECPKMKSFSYGSVSTPTLNGISTRSCYCSLKGDLNTTIQHIFKGKEAEMDHIHPAQEQIDVVDKEE